MLVEGTNRMSVVWRRAPASPSQTADMGPNAETQPSHRSCPFTPSRQMPLFVSTASIQHFSNHGDEVSIGCREGT